MNPKMCMRPDCGKFVDADDYDAAHGWILNATVVSSAGLHSGYDVCSAAHLEEIAAINQSNYDAMIAERAEAAKKATADTARHVADTAKGLIP